MTSSFEMPEKQDQLALGHYLTLRIPPEYTYTDNDPIVADDGFSELRFQNFWIGQNAIFQDVPAGGNPQVHSFLPFGFSGATANRNGDNSESALVFPNNSISRSFVDKAVQQQWTAVVRVCMMVSLVNPETPPTQLYRYVGQVSGGSWTVTEIGVTLSSVLDAVDAQIPRRSLLQSHVGFVPISGSINL